MPRSARAWPLGALLAALAVACADADPAAVPAILSAPEPAPLPEAVAAEDSRCAGEAPTCLSACRDGVALGEATCKLGRWACAEGVKDTLCCDPVEAPDRCATWDISCADGLACPDGYTCVQSRLHPVPARDGICRLGELSLPPGLAACNAQAVTPASLLALAGAGPLKVDGLVEMEYSCKGPTCDPTTPCCKACTGSLRVQVVDPSLGVSVALPIRTETVACAGSNCGITCAPMQPGRRYIVWGTYLPSEHPGGVGTLYHMGHCAP